MSIRQKQIIQKTVELVKKHFLHDSAHDWYHIERVWKMAKKLAKGESVHQFVLEMGALLHDVDDYKYKKEGESELAHTVVILDGFSISDSDKADILDIVSHVSFKGAAVATKQSSREGQIVQDADRLDGMGAIAIARTFAYNGSKGTPIYDPNQPPRKNLTFTEYKKGSTAINHFYEKLLLLKDRLNTPQAKKIAEKRHVFMKQYLKEFFRELQETA